MKKIEAINQAINETKFISAKMINHAKSGHTGIALGASKILFTLYKDHLFFNPDKPEFYFRDRFVLSAGHGSSMLYATLKLFGYNYSSFDLNNFRNLDSITPGHPEVNKKLGIEATTGPLGQGIANAVGLAIAENYLANTYNKPGHTLFDNYTYCLCGDGDLMEGVAQEAISLAGTLKLNNLILIYDKNSITIDGKLESANSEDEKFKLYSQNWEIFEVPAPYGYEEITATIKVAKGRNNGKPKFIVCKSIIGDGSIYSGKNSIHGTYLKDNELEQLKKTLHVDIKDYDYSEESKNIAKRTIEKNKELYVEKIKVLNSYKTLYPDLHKELFDKNQKISLDPTNFTLTEKITGRDANNKVLNALAKQTNFLLGGSADLMASTKAYIGSMQPFKSDGHSGRNIYYGVREHAMSAISNGIALYGKLIPFCSTFLSFSQYMLNGIRMSALMNLPVLYIFTHDSIIVGQDGPTHEPVEHINQLRLIPNLAVYRPCCYEELIYCYNEILSSQKPACLILSKENLPELTLQKNDIEKGIYSVSKASDKPQIKIIASGYEMHLALQTQKFLEDGNIPTEVYSAVNLANFDIQPEEYKQSVLDADNIKVSIEAGSDMCWYKYLQKTDVIIANNTYGESGAPMDVYKKHGFTLENVVKQIYKCLKNLV